MLKYVPVFLLVAFATSQKIDPDLLKTFTSQSKFNIVINFIGGTTKVLETIQNRSFENRTDKINSLVVSLQSATQSSQHTVLTFLKSKSIQYKSFWISNQIFVTGADQNLLQTIVEFPEVERVEEVPVAKINVSIGNVSSHSNLDPVPLAQWNIEKIQAEDAWSVSDGQGVTVGNIDSGVRYTHQTLSRNFRSWYGWFDPYSGTTEPYDDNGHGTHTMGTIAGFFGVGVAPGAQWIACKGCDSELHCSGDALVACGQWMLCPTLADGSNPDCNRAPRIVSNSWSNSLSNNPFYEPITDAWIAAGIIPIFSLGNNGPNCETIRSPGDMKRVIGVGGTNSDDQIGDFSGVGPTVDGRVKPDVSAPGESVRSAFGSADDAYAYYTGTSMAAPHVAGVTAILLAAKRTPLDFDEVRNILQAGVDTSLTSKNRVCDGVPDTTFPNFHFGFGRINAIKVLRAAGIIG